MKIKLKAAFVHLAISASIVSLFIAFVLTVWYPAPFLEVSGLTDIILILISVDLILGPLLTFVVFKSQKPSLKFDMAMIVAIQLGALSYGMFTIYSAHPLYVAFSGDRFSLINTNEVSPENAKYVELRKSKLAGPSIAYVQKPTDPQELSRIIKGLFSGQPDLDARTEYYQPIANFIYEIFKHSIPTEKLQSTPENQQKLNNFLKEYAQQISDYAFLILSGKEKDVIWAWNRKTGKPVDILDIDPWHLDQVATNNQKTL